MMSLTRESSHELEAAVFSESRFRFRLREDFRAAQRLFIASDIRFLPSGLRARLWYFEF
jgi:hypothetical protein